MIGSSVSSVMAKTEIAALKEALQTQQQLLQKVYKELEEEREASASAASEALSMILRLQGEKAAEKMEASQYKRMVEEKMHYAEECLSVFDDLMYSKEMEIASLLFQIHAYRYKLLSLGFTNPCVGKMKFPDNQYLQRNEFQIGELGLPEDMRRYNSLPPIPLKDAQSMKGKVENEGSAAPLQELIAGRRYNSLPLIPLKDAQSMKGKVENEGSAAPLQELIAGKNDEQIEVVSEESAVGDFNSYWEQIKRLDERVKEFSYKRVVERVGSELISRNHDLSLTMGASSMLTGLSRTCSLTAAVRRDLPLDPMGGATKIKMDSEGISPCSTSKAEVSDDFLGVDASSIPYLESETIASSIHSRIVHDVLEFPQNRENHKSSVSQKQQKKVTFKGETRLWKQQSVPAETSEYYFKEKDEWIKKVLQYAHRENKLPQPRDGVTVDYRSPIADANIDVSSFQSEVQQLKKRLELLEDDRRITNQEDSNRGEEQLQLLTEIYEQLKGIKSEIDNLKSSPSQDKSELLSLIEAMLCCSL